MIQFIVFSCNRPMQLDALLNSVAQHCKSLEYDVSVIYNYSSDEYRRGYDILIEHYLQKLPIIFIKEQVCSARINISKSTFSVRNIKHIIANPKLLYSHTTFRQDILSVLDATSAQLVCFLTDDSVFVDDVHFDKDVEKWIAEQPSRRQYTLRLCSTFATTNDYIWDAYEHDFLTDEGYVFSVDGHLYDRDFMREVLGKYVFSNPNNLEGFVSSVLRKKGMLGEMRCTHKRLLLSYPLNMVQTEVDNYSQGLSAKTLNDYFLAGYRMVYPLDDVSNDFQQYPDEIVLQRNDERLTISLTENEC